MKITVKFIDFSREEFIMEGPNADYYFKDGYLIVTSDCFFNKPTSRVIFNPDEVFCVMVED